jgi:hypothetical protein
MAPISATAEQEIKTLLVNWWTAVNTQLAAATGSAVQIGTAPVDLLFGSEIGQRLVRIAEVAEGITDAATAVATDAALAADAAAARQGTLSWSEDLANQILADCEAVETWLNQGPVFHKTPDAFWASPIGFMLLRAKVWANQDHLITLSAAADISGMSLSVLSQRMTRGQLPGYRDPSIKNPKHGRRVRLSDLHTLINETSDHNPFSTPYLIPQASRIPAPSSPQST